MYVTAKKPLWVSFWFCREVMPLSSAQSFTIFFCFRYGHMLNGNRVYYMKRSQPPIIAMIVDEYCRHPNVLPADRENIVKEILPALEREYKFWMTNRTIPVEVDGKSYTLNIFKGGIGRPRPESYMEDINTASHLLPGQQSKDAGSQLGVCSRHTALCQNWWSRAILKNAACAPKCMKLTNTW